MIQACCSQYQGAIKYKAPNVMARTTLVIRLGLLDKNKQIINDTNIPIEVVPQVEHIRSKRACVIGDNGAADQLAWNGGLFGSR